MDKGSLLVVDDTADSLRVLVEILQMEGYQVRPADGGGLALAAARARLPELILLDVRMPDVNGLEVCRQLKADPLTRDIPVIFLSASEEFQERLEGFRVGAVDFVAKPFQREELLARVRTHLELGRLRSRLEKVVADRTTDLSKANEKLGSELERRRSAEAELRASNAKLLLALAVAKLGYWEYDVRADRFTFDEDFLSLYGASSGPVHMKFEEYVERFVAAQDRAAVRAELVKAQAAPEGNATYQLEHRIVRGDGTPAHVLVRYGVVHESGQLVRIYGCNQDISERKAAEASLEQLRHSQRLDSVGRLAGGIAHDFNNLLTIILGHLELARARKPSETVLANLQEATQAGESAAALTRQLLLFARKQPSAPVALSLNEIVVRTHRMLRRVIGEDVALEVKVTSDIPPVWIDPAQFEQVLLNLAVNARDAMPQGGRLAISTDRCSVSDEQRASYGIPRARHGFVRLSVADTGTGMSEDVRAHIFEPFFTTKEAGKGTGIGLATVQSVVRTAGGFIEVDSTLGKGTRFDIYLPATQERSPVRSDDPTDIPQASNEYVALVEDQAAVRALAQNQLQLLGYQVGAFASAEDALRALSSETQQVDVLITDVVLRGMDGPTLVERLRERQPDLPVLYMSGYTDDLTLARGVDAASVHFLRKPFSIREIAQAVRYAIDGVRATTQQESD